MRNKVICLLIIIMLSFLLLQATVVEIGDGTVTSQGLPCEPYYNYSIAQSIYLQEWFDVDNQSITEISYHYNGNQGWTENSVTIWMGHTDLNSFDSSDSWVSIDDLTIVYEGAMTLQAVDSWVTFELIVPFQYINSQNLVIGFEQNSPGYHNSANEFFCTAVDNDLSIESHRDSADYDFINPPFGTIKEYIPNTIFTFEETILEPQILVTPESYQWNDTIMNSLGEEQHFVVRNSGVGSLVINNISLDQSSDFILTDTNTYPVSITSEIIQFTVTFFPQSVGDFNGNIIITDDNDNVTNIPLNGSGYDAIITEFPLFEGFENDLVNTLPQGWASIVESTNQYAAVNITAAQFYEGTQCVKFINVDDVDASLSLVTPPVQDLIEKRVRFMAKATSEGTGMIVGTYNGQSSISTLSPIDTIFVTTTYEQYIVKFEDYSGTDEMIGFKYVGNDETYVISVIDNISIENNPSGPMITVSSDTLDFGEIYVNRESTNFFTITNWGAENLIGSLECEEPYFTFETSDFEVEPSESIQMEVNFIPQEEGAFLGSFTVISNDITTPEISISGVATVIAALPGDISIIGNGNTTSLHMPIDPYYGYSYSQVIYYAGEIGNEGRQIEKLSWYYFGGSWSGDDVNIYLGHTDLNEFASTTSWLDINEFVPVFDGVLEVTSETGWVEFELAIPFIYDDSRNLVIAFEENTPGYHDSSDDFLGTESNYARGLVSFSDSVNPDPFNPPEARYIMNAFANLKLEFGDIPNEPVLAVYPANTTFPMTSVDTQSEPKVIKFSSNGLQDVVIPSTPVISGVDADQFSISVDSNAYPLTLPFNIETQISIVFSPTSEGYKNAILEITDNSTRIIHQVDLNGYGYAEDGNNNAAGATVIEIPTFGEIFAISPVGDVDWYKLPNLEVLDTLIIYTEMVEDNYINMSAWLYGPATNPANIDLSNPIANDSGSHGYDQPEIYYGIIEDGDYYLRIAENTMNPAGVNSPNLRKNPNGETARNSRESIGLYELTVDALFDYEYNAPLNLEAVNSDGFVSLSWTEPPYERYLVSYDIYRDGEQVNELPVEDTFYNDSGVTVGVEYSYTVVGIYEDPNGQSLHSNTISITYFSTGEALFSDDFESHDDFTLSMANWIQYDEDGAGTYAISGVDFANYGEPMAYIVFNPSATIPPVLDMDIQVGEKILCSFASAEGVNSDWLISPRITVGTTSVVSFDARSYTNQYELEKFKVLMSQGGDEIDDFSFSLHQNSDYIVAPTEWTPYYFNVSELTGMTVRFAVQCISSDGFIFMMDNFRVDSTDDGVSNDNDVTPVLTQLDGNYPNPFNPETTISYSMKEAGDVRIDIYNLKGQRVKTVVNEFAGVGAHQVVWNGQDDSNNSCASGLYFYKMKSGRYSKTNKMILMK